MSLAVRPATPDDLPAIRAMMRAFAEELNAIDEPEEVSDAAIARIADLAFGARPVCTLLIAELQSAPAGYLSYFWGLSMEGVAPALFVGDLYVAPDARRREVGRRLMAEAREIARAAGSEQVNWTVWRKNTTAQRFYAAIGARPYAEEILMTWPVEEKTS